MRLIMLEISEDDEKEISENSLVCLDLSYQTEIFPCDLVELISCKLKGNTSVTSLVFEKCDLDDDCVRALASALEIDGRIIGYISLNSNRITDTGLISLLSLSNIQNIDCSYNTITDRVVPTLLARDREYTVNLLGNDGISETNENAIYLHFKHLHQNISNIAEGHSQPKEDDKEPTASCAKKLKLK